MLIVNGFSVHVILKVFNCNGEGLIILRQDNLGNAKPNQDRHKGDLKKIQGHSQVQGIVACSIVQNGSHANCLACFQLIFWRWSMPFTWDTRKEIRFFTYFQCTKKGRRRKLLYTMIHGMNIGFLKINELRNCWRMTQISCNFPTIFFYMGRKSPHPSTYALH